MKASFYLAIAALFCTPHVFAMQQDESSLMDDILTKLGSSETVDESKLIDWGVLPGPFVNPEQGFGIGVAPLGCTHHTTGNKATLIQPSLSLLTVQPQALMAWA